MAFACLYMKGGLGSPVPAGQKVLFFVSGPGATLPLLACSDRGFSFRSPAGQFFVQDLFLFPPYVFFFFLAETRQGREVSGLLFPFSLNTVCVTLVVSNSISPSFFLPPPFPCLPNPPLDRISPPCGVFLIPLFFLRSSRATVVKVR